jgi:cytochrome c-type biogenesis protein
MTVLLVFLEGILTFISPCVLPMLPVYLIYLAGGEEKRTRRLVINTLGFILGFTLVFVLLGATASGIGQLLATYRSLLQRVGGVIMILIGLYFAGVIKIGALPNASGKIPVKLENLRFFSSVLFGVAFTVSWSACLSAYLGSVMVLAANADTLAQGIGLLLVFALGLGVPFMLTALLWGQLKGAFRFIKKHSRKISLVSGLLLIVIGLLMLFDLFGYYLGLY